jgi:hypothetical protein
MELFMNIFKHLKRLFKQSCEAHDKYKKAKAELKSFEANSESLIYRVNLSEEERDEIRNERERNVERQRVEVEIIEEKYFNNFFSLVSIMLSLVSIVISLISLFVSIVLS